MRRKKKRGEEKCHCVPPYFFFFSSVRDSRSGRRKANDRNSNLRILRRPIYRWNKKRTERSKTRIAKERKRGDRGSGTAATTVDVKLIAANVSGGRKKNRKCYVRICTWQEQTGPWKCMHERREGENARAESSAPDVGRNTHKSSPVDCAKSSHAGYKQADALQTSLPWNAIAICKRKIIAARTIVGP